MKKVLLIASSTKNLMGKVLLVRLIQHFLAIFRKSYSPDWNMFLQDTDPNQNSARVTEVLNDMGLVEFYISFCSSDCNLIENLFCLIKPQLMKTILTKALHMNHTKALLAYVIEAIRITVFIPRLMRLMVENGGERLDYEFRYCFYLFILFFCQGNI